MKMLPSLEICSKFDRIEMDKVNLGSSVSAEFEYANEIKITTAEFELRPFWYFRKRNFLSAKFSSKSGRI